MEIGLAKDYKSIFNFYISIDKIHHHTVERDFAKIPTRNGKKRIS